jgi:hypothetical protein
MKITFPKEEIPGVFTVKLSGETTIQDIFKLLKTAIIILARKKSDKILIDITEELNKFNLMDTLEIVEHYPDMLRKYKIAVLDLPKNYEKIKMHEKMANKRGFRVFGFTDKDDAVKWLLGDTHNEVIPRRI